MFMNKISTGCLCKWVSTPGLPESSPGPNLIFSVQRPIFFLHLVHIILKVADSYWHDFFSLLHSKEMSFVFSVFFSYSE